MRIAQCYSSSKQAFFVVVLVTGLAVSGSGSARGQAYIQNFNALAQTNTNDTTFRNALITEGWTFLNRSDAGPSQTLTPGWGRGNSTPTDVEGNPNRYMDITFAAGPFYADQSQRGVASVWAISPTLNFRNGSVISFYTRATINGTVTNPDRLQVRFSSSGSSADVGTGPNDVGVFNTLLTDINPNYLTSGAGSYPTTWTRYDITLSGLAANGASGRVAFRYFLTQANGNSPTAQGDFVGIDNLAFNLPEPSSGLLAVLYMGTAVHTFRRVRLTRSSNQN